MVCRIYGFFRFFQIILAGPTKALDIYISSPCRSSHRRCSVKKGVLRNITKFTGKDLCQRLFFNKVAGLRPATLLEKSLWHRCFPVNFVKFLRTFFLQNTSGQLLLTMYVFIIRFHRSY